MNQELVFQIFDWSGEGVRLDVEDLSKLKVSIGPVDSFSLLRPLPGPDVIKLLTAVIYEFS